MKNSLFGALCIATLFFSGCFLNNNKQSDTLFVGTNSGFPPYEQLDTNGNLKGFDIDVANEIGKRLGKKIIIHDMAFDSLIVALKQGKLDAIIAGISITQARQQEMTMIHYHGKPLKVLPIIFWAKIPSGVTTIEDLQHSHNKTICVQAGTIQEEIICKKTYLDIKHLENIADLIMDIKYGKSIATVIEPSVVESLQQQEPLLQKIDLPLDQTEQDLGNGIGIAKTNTSLSGKIEQIVATMKADGTLEQLEHKWFKKGNNNDK
jgi:ABC-type amino acid transport substrate-binding protein